MTFGELKKALLTNEIEISESDLRQFNYDEAVLLGDDAQDWRDASRAYPLPGWVQSRGLNRAACESIAENYEWAADEIERLAAKEEAA